MCRSTLKPETRDNYNSGNKHLMKFIIKYCPTLKLPLRDIDWSLFIQYLKDQKLKESTALGYLNHVSNMQQSFGFQGPKWQELPLTRKIRRLMSKISKSSRSWKYPVTYAIGCRMVKLLNWNNMEDLITGCLILTMICGLFRAGEMLTKTNREFNNIRLMRSGYFKVINDGSKKVLRIWLPGSKTDVYNRGVAIFIPAAENKQYCAVEWIEKLLKQKKDPFTPMFTNKNGTLITKTTFMKKTRKLLRRIGEEPKNYSGHSFRKGGAVSAHLAGLGSERIRTLGRWTTDAFMKYTHFIPREIMDLLKRIHVKT